MDIMTSLKNQIIGKNIRIVFPEGNEPRVVQAASLLARENMLKPILIGSIEEVQAAAGTYSLEGCEIIDPKHYDKLDEMVTELVAVRKGKVTEEQARELVLNSELLRNDVSTHGISRRFSFRCYSLNW